MFRFNAHFYFLHPFLPRSLVVDVIPFAQASDNGIRLGQFLVSTVNLGIGEWKNIFENESTEKYLEITTVISKMFLIFFLGFADEFVFTVKNILKLQRKFNKF